MMRRHNQTYKIILLCSTAIKICMFFPVYSHAADMPRLETVPTPPMATPIDTKLPAVSGVNGSVGAYVCSYDGDISGGALGSFTTPIGDAHGMQLDGMLGVNDEGKLIGQANGHLFWRDPQVGLLGLYGAYIYNRNDYDGARLGVEGEIYRDRITLSGIGGWDFGADKPFVQSRLSYYLTDNTKIYAGYLYERRSIGAIGAEHLFQNSPVAIFAEGRLGEDNYKAAFAGLRLYWRGNNSASEPDPSYAENISIKDPTPIPVAMQDVPRSLKVIDREDVVPLWVQLCSDPKKPTVEPTAAPTPEPTIAPTKPTKPTPEPTAEPTPEPTAAPTSTPRPTKPQI